jgi:hypothetical protein
LAPMASCSSSRTASPWVVGSAVTSRSACSGVVASSLRAACLGPLYPSGRPAKQSVSCRTARRFNASYLLDGRALAQVGPFSASDLRHGRCLLAHMGQGLGVDSFRSVCGRGLFRIRVRAKLRRRHPDDRSQPLRLRPRPKGNGACKAAHIQGWRHGGCSGVAIWKTHDGAEPSQCRVQISASATSHVSDTKPPGTVPGRWRNSQQLELVLWLSRVSIERLQLWPRSI